MRVVYFGTPVFAADVLDYLVASGVDIVAVISREDKPKGRSKEPVATPVKEVALAHGIPVFQPAKVSSEEFLPTLKSFDADLFVVVAYGEILKQHVLDIPRLACINLHASLLPKYRGAAPIQRCLMEGESETGVTIMHMVRKMDAGDMIAQCAVPIGPNMTFGELELKLREAGKPLLLQVILEKKFPGIPQDDSRVTHAAKIELEDCEINWNLPAEAIHNLVRGVNPYPCAWCFVTVGKEKKRLKILETELVDATGNPGDILENNNKRFIVACGKGALSVILCQLEGKKLMRTVDLMRGLDHIRCR